MTDIKKRTFELAWGIHISADPETLDKNALIDELYDVANYASRRLSEARALRGVLHNAISKDNT